MTGVELSELEVDLIVVATALFGWAPQAEAMEAVRKVTAQIVAARLEPVEAERDEALEYKIMALTPHGLDAEIIRERARTEAADAKFRRCLESENRAQANLAAAEAEVVRLTAERDAARRQAANGCVACTKAADEVRAENRRLTALVEAGLGLADELAQMGNGWRVVDPGWAARKIRAVLGGAAND